MTRKEAVMIEIAKRCTKSDLRASELLALTNYVLEEVDGVVALVDESRRLFHDSTVWEDEDYVEPHDIAARWKVLRGEQP